MRRFVPTVLAACAASALLLSSWSRADDKAKFSIKDVMKEHKKGALKDKVVEGKATDDEKKKLVEVYTELGKNKPPKGDEESWKKLTDAMVQAAKEVQEGKDGATDRLNKAVNCANCHKAHKPS